MGEPGVGYFCCEHSSLWAAGEVNRFRDNLEFGIEPMLGATEYIRKLHGNVKEEGRDRHPASHWLALWLRAPVSKLHTKGTQGSSFLNFQKPTILWGPCGSRRQAQVGYSFQFTKALFLEPHTTSPAWATLGQLVTWERS